MSDFLISKDFLKNLKDQINKEAKTVLALLGTDDLYSKVTRYIPYGITYLDYAHKGRDAETEFGGVPIGRMIEIYGEESHGKSTLATHAMIQCQKMGGLAVLIDSESGFDPSRASLMGLDLENNFLSSPASSVEDGFIAIHTIIDKLRSPDSPYKDRPLLFVWDTIAGSPTKKELSGEGSAMMEKPKLLRAEFRKLSVKLAETKTALILVNQVMASLDAMGRFNVESPGGYAIKHYASIRIHVRRTSYCFENGTKCTKYDLDRAGIITDINVVKCKLFPPAQHVRLCMLFNTGYNDVLSMYYFIEDNEIGKVSGSWRTVELDGKEYRFQGINGYLKLAVDNYEFIEALKKKIKSHFEYRRNASKNPLQPIKPVRVDEDSKEVIDKDEEEDLLTPIEDKESRLIASTLEE